MALLGGLFARLGLSSPLAPWLAGAALLMLLSGWHWSRLGEAEERGAREERARSEAATEEIIDEAERLRNELRPDPGSFDERRELRRLKFFGDPGDTQPP